MGDRLSGGEQQMLAIGRTLMTNPKLPLLDDPFEGLAPGDPGRAGRDHRPAAPRGRLCHHHRRTAGRGRAAAFGSGHRA
ncbi:MAG: ATP-binding cassette domain-containing protein [Pseudodonghicola sp.]